MVFLSFSSLPTIPRHISLFKKDFFTKKLQMHIERYSEGLRGFFYIVLILRQDLII